VVRFTEIALFLLGPDAGAAQVHLVQRHGPFGHEHHLDFAHLNPRNDAKMDSCRLM
jgi:hypothetical protein